MAITVVMTGTNQSVSATNGSPTVTIANTTGIAVGATIQATGFVAGTKVLSVVANTSVTLSANYTGVTGAVAAVFSSNNATITLTASASGDNASPANILSAGFGVSYPLAQRNIQFAGNPQIRLKLAKGAIFDQTAWTITLGFGGSLRADLEYGAGTWVDGYTKLPTGAWIKSAGSTVNYDNFANSNGIGGASIFIEPASPPSYFPTDKFQIKWNDCKWVEHGGANSAAILSTKFGEFDSGKITMNYYGNAGANAGFVGSYGYIDHLVIYLAIGSTGTGFDPTKVTTTGKFELYSNIGTAPLARWAFPHNVPVYGHTLVSVTSPETAMTCGWNTTNSCILYDYNYPTDFNIGTQWRNYVTNTGTWGRTVKFKIQDSSELPVANTTVYVNSGAVELFKDVVTGDFNQALRTWLLDWNGRIGTASYIAPVTVTRTTAQTYKLRNYGYYEVSGTMDLTNAAKDSPIYFRKESTLLAEIPKATALADTDVSVDWVAKKLIVAKNATVSTMQLLAKARVEQALPVNMPTVDFIAINGTTLTLFDGWTIELLEGAEINKVDNLNQIAVTGLAIIQGTGSSINMPYSDVDGLRLTVTGLDPESLGNRWDLRYKITGSPTWTTMFGTGNVAAILAATGNYDVEVREQGYYWKSFNIDTSISLSTDANLIFHPANDDTPQYTKPFDAATEAIFSYDSVAMQVAANNTTGLAMEVNFAEAYRAIQRILHMPALVWEWTNPIKYSSLTQTISIPDGNPLAMYLTPASNAHVRFTCPIINEETGTSAYDRVRGNSTGYQIILGSTASAESANLVDLVVKRLGGADFLTESHNLKIIHDLAAIASMNHQQTGV